MVTNRTRYKILLPVFSLLAASPALASDPIKPLVLNGRYTITWSGIPLGRIYITADETDASYSMTIDTKTKGIGALISDEKRVITANGKKSSANDFRATYYNSRPHKKKGDEDIITLTYDDTGKIIKRERTREDDPSWRPLVSFDTINTGHDPITAGFILRRQLYATLDSNETRVATRTYDGLRLAEMSLTRSLEDSRVAIMGSYTSAINARVNRKPIEGYTPKELKKYIKGDPEIRIYFSHDADFLPVRASAKTTIGELSMTLVEMK